MYICRNEIGHLDLSVWLRRYCISGELIEVAPDVMVYRLHFYSCDSIEEIKSVAYVDPYFLK